MTTRILQRSLVVMAIAGSLIACGGQNGFNTAGSTGAGGSGGNGSLSNGGTPEYQTLNMKSYISGGAFDQSLVIDIDKVQQELIITVPLSMNPFIGEAWIELQNLPGVKIVASTDANGYSSMSLRVPLRYILKNPINFLPPGRLPNGDPLPGFPGGELPTTAVLVNSHGTKLNLYIGVDGVAVFVESKYSPGGIYLALPIMTRTPVRQIGTFAMIPPKGSYQGGFYLAVKLPSEIARILEENVRL